MAFNGLCLGGLWSFFIVGGLAVANRNPRISGTRYPMVSFGFYGGSVIYDLLRARKEM